MTVVAVLGAGGIMGRPMARNMAATGLEVRAWNRTREKCEPLADEGVTVVDALAEAADGADVVVTILADTEAVEEVVRDALPEGVVWAQMSTVGLDGTERLGELAGERGAAFVDAPVLGTKAPAENGELIVLASGPEHAREAVDPVFDAVGKQTRWVGEAGAGTRLKVAINAWILSLVEATAETLALAEGLGVDPREVLDTLAGGPLDLPYLQLKGKMIVERSFEPSMKLEMAAKDARLIAEAAERHGLDLPLLEVVRDRLAQGAEHHGDEDMAATYRTSAPRP